jgi:hypothetical protein
MSGVGVVNTGDTGRYRVVIAGPRPGYSGGVISDLRRQERRFDDGLVRPKPRIIPARYRMIPACTPPVIQSPRVADHP